MNDTGWSQRRERMVRTQLERRGVASARVLQAMARVPRERFVSPGDRPRAYADCALPIGHGQTISQPYMVAAMTEALGLRGPERVLEVGTGSGYQCAVLAELARAVYSVERIPELAREAAAVLADLSYANVTVRDGDGSLGWPEEAPFDAILVTAAAPRVPSALLAQLDPAEGRLVAPVGDRELQHLVVVERSGNAWVTRQSLGCRFVPLLGEEGWPG